MTTELHDKIIKLYELSKEIQTQMPKPEDCENNENELYDSIVDFIYEFENYKRGNSQEKEE